jgi:DNA polymerase-3 subunit gamma/tau
MSYQVLARKWRPRNFASLVGQEHVVKALRHALEHKRLHHAYLFTGTRGVGKTTLARILAKCLNCENGVTPEPCGKCSACVEIDGGRFVDLLEVDAATNTKVEEMRQLLETAQYSPTRGRYKVYVIDEVHMLSNSAFNAMLKTLEEPPEHLKFVLATTDPQKIPVTVLSRCLQFNLKQMPRPAIAAHLARILEAEGVVHEGEVLPLIGRAAAGSMRDALSLLDQAIAHGAGKLSVESVREMLGAIDESYLFRLLDAVAAGDGRAVMAVADEMQQRSLSFDTALQDLATILLNVSLAQMVPEALADDLPERERIVALGARLDAETVQLDYQIALQGREDLELAPDEHAGFVMTLLRMLAFRPEGGEPARAPVPQTAAAPAAAAGARRATASAGATGFDGDWTKLAPQLALSGLARELARHSVLKKYGDGKFELAVPKALAHLVSQQGKLKIALEQHLGRPATVKVVAAADAAGDSAAAVEAAQTSAKQAEISRSLHGDAFVKDLVNLFDGTVIESTIKSTNGNS